MIMDDSYLTLENIDSKLKSLPIDTSNYRSIVEFIFEDCIVDLMHMLDSEFNSELGRPAYPRLMILGLCLFGEEKGIQYLSELNRTCYTDDIFKTLINDRVPSRNIFSNFLDWNDEIIFLSVFLYTLVKINDYDFLPKDNNNYLDGTDARINGSVNYLITEDEIEALELMKHFKLIHDGSDEQKRKSRTQAKLKLRYYKNHPEYSKLFGLAIKRIELYNWTIYNKIDEFKEAITNIDKNYVSINFPESIKLPCKKNDWDMGFNLTRTHDKQQHNPNRTPITITQRFRSLKRSRTESKKKFQNSRKTTKRLWRTLELQTTKKIIPKIRRILRFGL